MGGQQGQVIEGFTSTPKELGSISYVSREPRECCEVGGLGQDHAEDPGETGKMKRTESRDAAQVNLISPASHPG